ncbi:MAG: fumarylacetoacetate hydrolase family protein [Rhodobacteraceae bacterium]|nr:fumarylacetoacetate hydrolase family protein [Paracoccaceae bacterium]
MVDAHTVVATLANGSEQAFEADAVLGDNALTALASAAATAPRLPLASVTLLPPVPNPDKILCVGLNYLAHILEGGREPLPYPSMFTRYPASVVGHGSAMARPAESDKFDFEGEMAVVIGKPGRRIDAANALDHVAGYTCFNDGSIRDYQGHSSQFWPGKNFQNSGAMGPWIVTADEAPDPGAMHLRTLLNGQEVQSSPVSDLAIGVADLIAYISTVIELLPGDVIATGTPSGVGLYRKPPLFMKAGDVVEVEISGIGTLRNPVVDG